MSFIFLVLCFAPLFCKDVYSDADEATKAVLAKVDALIEQGQYQSAFTAASEVGTFQEEYLLAKRVEIAINYFAQSIMHQMFAFKNLEEGETLYDVRTGDGTFSLMMADPVIELGALRAKIGERPILDYAQGLYYSDTLYRYGDQWLITPDELYEKTSTYLQKAYDAACYDDRSVSLLAEAYLFQGKFDMALPLYERKEKESSLTIGDCYHYGILLGQTGQAEKGLPYVEKSIEGYGDIPEYQFDAYSIAVQMCISLQKYDRAEKILIDFKRDFSTDYRVILYTIMLYAAQSDNEKAVEASFELFAIAPSNPSACQLIMQQAEAVGNFDFLPDFFDQALILYSEDNGARENLYFHYAYSLGSMGRLEEAYDMAIKAKEVFTENGSLTSEIEENLNQLIMYCQQASLR